MTAMWNRLLPHGRRGLAAAAAAVVLVLLVSVMARAELGAAPAGDDTAASSAATTSSAGGDGGNGDNNVAVAANGKDDKTVYALRLKVVLTGKETIDPTNAAVAAASCSNCTTIAVALEGVVVWGEPEVVAPVNLALALNTECQNCQTLAAAYQYLTQADSRVRITGEGRRTIAALRRDLNAIRTADLTLAEVYAEVDRIAGEFYQVLKTQVVPVGKVSGAFPAAGATPSPFSDDTPGDVAGAASDPDTYGEAGDPTGTTTGATTTASSPSDSQAPRTSSETPSDTSSPSETASTTP